MHIFSRAFFLPLAFTSLTALTLGLGGCTTTANQQVNVAVGSPTENNSSPLSSGQNASLFRALGGAGLNPTVALFCNNENVAGDRGYARQVARTYRAYLNQLLSETTGGNGSQTGSVYGIDPLTGVPVQFPTPGSTTSPEATPMPNPFPTAQDDISIVEKTSFNGKVFDSTNAPLDGATVTARSLNTAISYEVETTTSKGTFAFNNAPAGVQIEIIVSRPGYAQMRRVEVLKSNKQGDPNANRYDFGTGDGSNSSFGTEFNALTDEPLVTQILPGRNASGISPETPVVLTFSEPVDRATVESNFALCIQPAGTAELQVVYSLADFTANWSSDDSQVTFTPKPDVKLNSGERYAIGFKAGDGVIKDKSGIARTQDHFKLTDGRYEPGSYFTVEGEFNAQQFKAQQATFQPLPPPAKVRDSFYFSYDDSASTASVELFKHAMSNNQLPNPAWSKTWEFLNYEHFDQLEQESLGLFKASMGLWKYPHLQNPYLDTYEVGIHLSAPYKCKATRQQMVLTVLLDISTSMQDPASSFSQDGSEIPSKQMLAIEGLKAMTAQLKAGDQVNLILFNNKAKTVLDSFKVGQDPEALFARALDEIKLEGGTNLQSALGAAYDLAEKQYDTRKMNRILFITDAQATEGNVDMGLVRAASATDNGRPIYLSGLGMGFSHDSERMNRITEEGHGAYYSVNTLTDMQEAMGDRFIPLMDVIARNVRFQIEFPGFMRHNKSASEELSANPSQVQPTNFSANTSQFFWEQFLSNKTDFTGNEKVVLTITYEDPRSRQQKTERLEKTLAEILDKDLQNIKAAHMVSLTTALVRREVSATEVREELTRLLPDVGR